MKYLNALNKISGVGPQKIKILLNFFQESENIWQADLATLKQSGISEKLAEIIWLEKKTLDPNAEWDKLQKENIRLLALTDSKYPQLLKEISNPPYLLYIKGNFDFNLSPAIAIVGARKCTEYGAQVARSFAKNLTTAGLTVVSGLALGIDSFAHRGALDSEGLTIAVLGNSLDDKNIYPVNNFNLAHEIVQKGGALLSEYPIETMAGKLTFPARNRLIAGLSLGTLIVEAGEKSGALLTAQMALDDNREVFAVPGSIFSPVSIGTHQLLRNGAKLTSGIKDILEELNLEKEKNQLQIELRKPSNQEEELLLRILAQGPLHIDNLTKMTKLQTAVISSTLSLLEIKGWIKNIGGQNYTLI